MIKFKGFTEKFQNVVENGQKMSHFLNLKECQNDFHAPFIYSLETGKVTCHFALGFEV